MKDIGSYVLEAGLAGVMFACAGVLGRWLYEQIGRR